MGKIKNFQDLKNQKEERATATSLQFIKTSSSMCKRIWLKT